jgi:hypothetical protein
MMGVKAENEDEVKDSNPVNTGTNTDALQANLLRHVFRLIVVTFIIPHTLAIDGEDMPATLSCLPQYINPSGYSEKLTSTRMIHPQSHYFSSQLQQSALLLVLRNVQQIFISSKGYEKWLIAFIAMLGMCIRLEDQQKTIHSVMSIRAKIELRDVRVAQEQASAACREIDEWMLFVMQIARSAVLSSTSGPHYDQYTQNQTM